MDVWGFLRDFPPTPKEFHKETRTQSAATEWCRTYSRPCKFPPYTTALRKVLCDNVALLAHHFAVFFRPADLAIHPDVLAKVQKKSDIEERRAGDLNNALAMDSLGQVEGVSCKVQGGLLDIEQEMLREMGVEGTLKLRQDEETPHSGLLEVPSAAERGQARSNIGGGGLLGARPDEEDNSRADDKDNESQSHNNGELKRSSPERDDGNIEDGKGQMGMKELEESSLDAQKSDREERPRGLLPLPKPTAAAAASHGTMQEMSHDAVTNEDGSEDGERRMGEKRKREHEEAPIIPPISVSKEGTNKEESGKGNEASKRGSLPPPKRLKLE